MNWLRATVRPSKDGWSLTLLDLDIETEGPTEQDMLRQLEYTLTAEYHVALKLGQTPFVSLLKGTIPSEVVEAWTNGDKSLRVLSLPDEVRLALSAVFRTPLVTQFAVQEMGHAA